MHLEPWFAPESISRVWCLFEIFTTLEVGGEVTVSLSTKDMRNFEATKASASAGDIDADGVKALLEKTIATVDARKAAATCPGDWNTIVQLILNAGKLDDLNNAVQTQLQIWLDTENEFDADAWTRQGQQIQMREFSGLIRDYTDRCYGFELVDWIRKVTLSGLLIFVERGSLTQLSVGTIISVGFACMQLVLQPYKRKEHNLLKTVVELFIALTFLFSFQIRAEGPHRNFKTFDFLLVGQVAIIALAMPLALLRWLVLALKKRCRWRTTIGTEYLGEQLMPSTPGLSDDIEISKACVAPCAVLLLPLLLCCVACLPALCVTVSLNTVADFHHRPPSYASTVFVRPTFYHPKR